MTTPFRHVTVAIGVVLDLDLGFLLFHNERWKGYAFNEHVPGGDGAG